MGEHQVSIGGTTIPVPEPFLVLATQNPIESEGVYQLPEAQRDRFLLKVDVAAPSESEELAILYRMSVDPPRPRPVLTPERLIALQRAADEVFVHHAVAEYAVRLVVSTRELAGPDSRLAHGAGPRATLGLVAAARALALLRGRGYVLPEDVHDLAHEVVAHRLVLSFDALADGITGAEIVDEVLAAVEQPRISPRQAATRPGEETEGEAA
jgi:MoxR-like ATPase